MHQFPTWSESNIDAIDLEERNECYSNLFLIYSNDNSL